MEFKSTLRLNLHTGQTDDRMQLAVLKTLAGFLNAQGGTLLIGVADDAARCWAWRAMLSRTRTKWAFT